eukprot:CAMPEP_0206233012 /NCGR_PEP_ID=MMETSP0047_2-20121206/11741_1 /ASSEMBLY_ACC=CAM_ASM_000192 /TAXON_ID=195065 /ORGANISM="Chroomonas mesostigmatica_cf, Strain CCMP1168" /LENGTH=45 /DNA_ID= /DNA_START= /DNA_END= /DNA_ORIENTATION=
MHCRDVNWQPLSPKLTRSLPISSEPLLPTNVQKSSGPGSALTVLS